MCVPYKDIMLDVRINRYHQGLAHEIYVTVSMPDQSPTPTSINDQLHPSLLISTDLSVNPHMRTYIYRSTPSLRLPGK